MCHMKLETGLLYLRLYKRLLFLSFTPFESSSLIRCLTLCFLTTKPLDTSVRCTLRYPTLEPLPFSSSCTACRISSLEERRAARGLLLNCYHLTTFLELIILFENHEHDLKALLFPNKRTHRWTI